MNLSTVEKEQEKPAVEHKIVSWRPCDPGWEAVCSCGWESRRAPLSLAEEQADAHGAVNAFGLKGKSR
jgi:hypothetical protein